MKVQFPRLEAWQEDVHKEITGQLGSSKRFVIKASRQKGKTFLAYYLLSNRITTLKMSNFDGKRRLVSVKFVFLQSKISNNNK